MTELFAASAAGELDRVKAVLAGGAELERALFYLDVEVGHQDSLRGEIMSEVNI